MSFKSFKDADGACQLSRVCTVCMADLAVDLLADEVIVSLESAREMRCQEMLNSVLVPMPAIVAVEVVEL